MVQNNITFNNVKEEGIELSSRPLIVKNNIGDGKVVNAVDIDWNGAEVENNVELNTTGELLTWIKSLPTIGINGKDGKSAYELYKETVNEQEAKPAIYSFESWNNTNKEVKWGEGTVKVIEMRAGGATVEVVTNSTDQSFVGKQFNIATALATNDPIQLYTLENEPTDIWVTVELVSEAQEAVVAMTESEWLESLKGAQGPQGETGETGPQGPQGETGPTGTFNDSALEDYATKEFVIGIVETLDNYEYIHDEDSWNASYANGVLKKYYASSPDEDLESTTPGKEVGFNDRIYVGTITGSDTVVRFKATWQAKSQLITNLDDSSETYYIERLDKTSVYYGTDDEWKAQYPKFQGYTWALYSDADLTTEVGKEFAIESLEFDGFIHTYNAWLNNGAQLPWICINFDTDVNAKIAFTYEGKKDVYPWLDKIFGTGEGHKTWGIASIPAEFIGDNSINNFDPSKFEIKLVSNTELDSKYVSKITYDALLDKFNKLSEKVNEIYNELHP